MLNTLNFAIVLFIGLYFISNDVAAEDCGEVDTSYEVSLHKKLLCKYDQNNRPVKNHNTPVNVTVKMLLRVLLYSSSWVHTEVVTVKSWISLKWIDEYMTWNPDEYGGLKNTLIHSSKIWIPDLSLYNSPEGKSAGFSYPCQISSTGSVTCIPQMSHSGYCSMNYKNWPYDRQNCTLVFGTWMHRGEQVNFILPKEPINLSDYRKNKYWKLISANVTRNPGVYRNFNETYPTLRYSFVIERHTATLVSMLVVPALVMVTMTIVSLCLDIASIERLGLMLFNIACHFYYVNNLHGFIPSNGDLLPDAMIYFRDSTILSCIVLFHCILLRNLVIYTKTVPVWVNRVTGIMSTGAGKIVFHEFDPTDSANIVAEDAENLSKDEIHKSVNREWRRLALFFNRTFTLVIVVTYFVLILIYIL